MACAAAWRADSIPALLAILATEDAAEDGQVRTAVDFIHLEQGTVMVVADWDVAVIVGGGAPLDCDVIDSQLRQTGFS